MTTRTERPLPRNHLLLVLRLSILASPLPTCLGLAATASIGPSPLLSWLLSTKRCTSLSNHLTQLAPSNRFKALHKIRENDDLFDLTSASALTASVPYGDMDLGGQLKRLAQSAGPGFESVALAAFLASERIRGFRIRVGQGRAPESTGQLVPSEWSSFTRTLWYEFGGGTDEPLDPELVPVIRQGVELILPMLDLVSRRSWDASSAGSANEGYLSEEWARNAMFDDGAGWSRADLEELAIQSFRMVIERQLFPPPFLDGSDGPGRWSDEEDPTASGPALVPLVWNVLGVGSGDGINAKLGMPPRPRVGSLNRGICLRCVAARDIEAGEMIVASDPWAT